MNTLVTLMFVMIKGVADKMFPEHTLDSGNIERDLSSNLIKRPSKEISPIERQQTKC